MLMAYLYVRHRGKHLLSVGGLVLCNKSENLPLERRRVGRLSIAGPWPRRQEPVEKRSEPSGRQAPMRPVASSEPVRRSQRVRPRLPIETIPSRQALRDVHFVRQVHHVEG